MELKVITHNRKQVLFVDYTQCKSQEDMISLLDRAVAYYKKSPTSLRILSDYTDAYGGIEYMSKLKNYAKELGDKTDKAAVIGIDGLKEILLKGYNMVSKKQTIPFRNKIQALNYLTSESSK